ncbi:MAG: hypothetical protein FWE67_10730 [Planctomycetaceae bacterium]|nr:hypothetical protein [Planctomycetaceae bacterium]
MIAKKFNQYVADPISRDMERRHRDWTVMHNHYMAVARREGKEEGKTEGSVPLKSPII